MNAAPKTCKTEKSRECADYPLRACSKCNRRVSSPSPTMENTFCSSPDENCRLWLNVGLRLRGCCWAGCGGGGGGGVGSLQAGAETVIEGDSCVDSVTVSRLSAIDGAAGLSRGVPGGELGALSAVW